MTREEVEQMIQAAVREERKRLADILESANPEYDWDDVDGSKFSFDSTLRALADQIRGDANAD